MATIRLNSRFSLGGTLALAAAALVSAGISTGVQAAGSYGQLRLQLGSVNQFVYPASPFSYVQRMYFDSKGSCLLVWDENDPALATLTPGGGRGESTPGFGPTSIGVYDGPKGTPCYRVSDYASESLTFALGSFTKSHIGANAFDRLELDVEVKRNAHVLLRMKIAGSETKVYELRTGSSIIPGVGLEPTGGTWPEADPWNTIVNCRARSDSGPDSGSSDNCRWIINDLGQQFTVETVPGGGEFSLEGGGDWAGAADANNSVIWLTYVTEGDLKCGEPTPAIAVGDVKDACYVTRADDDGYCNQLVHYVLREISGNDTGCEFIKAPGQQLAASATITFPKEPRTELESVPPTRLLFSGASAAFLPRLCTGTVIGGDNPTIAEVLSPTPPPSYSDVVPGNNFKDWACILSHSVEYLGPLLDPQMQVKQTILFWGDLMIIRN